MSLRLALVIDGDPAGAKKALTETASAVDALAKKTGEANKAAETGRNVWGDVAGKAGDAAKAVDAAAKSTGELASGFSRTAIEGGAAAPEIEKAGQAAQNADAGFGKLKINLGAVALSFAAGLGVGVLTAAFDALVQKGLEFARGVLTDGPRIEADLKSHAALVRDIRAAYAEADGAATSYGNRSGNLLKFSAQQDKARLERDLKSSLPQSLGNLEGMRELAGGADMAAFSRGSPFLKAIDDLRKGLADGKADVIAFRAEIGKIASALPEADPFRALAENMLAATEQAAGLQEDLARTKDILKGLDGDAEAAATALGGTAEKYGVLGDNAGAAAPKLDATAAGITATGAAAANAVGQINAMNAALARTPARAAVTDIVLPVKTLPAKKMAGGGEVFGAGTGTSDSVPALLSNGEFVVNAAAAQNFRPLLHAINSGRVGRHAEGGAIGAGALSYAASPGGVSEVAATAQDFSILRGTLAGLIEATRQGEDALASIGDMIMGKLEGFLGSMLDKLLQSVEDNLIKALEGAFSSSAGGGGGSNWLSDIIGFLFNGFSSGWAGGGYTGDGGKFEPAGVVHRGEYVFSSEATRAIGPGNLAALARASGSGFASGGFAGMSAPAAFSAPSVTFVNQGTPQRLKESREEDDGQGGRRTIMVLEDAVAGVLTRPGSKARSALRKDFGLAGRTVQR